MILLYQTYAPYVVEMRGIEPLCKTFDQVLSTCLFHLWFR
jgi:hypothetical protein